MLKIETISKKHDRPGFDCSVDGLNKYLRRIARQHLDKGMSRTFVLIDDRRPANILGFYTLAACEIRVENSFPFTSNLLWFDISDMILYIRPLNKPQNSFCV